MRLRRIVSCLLLVLCAALLAAAQDATPEATAEAIESAGGNEASVDGDEAGEILVFAAEAVIDPGAHTGASLNTTAGVEEVVGEGVFGELGDH